MAKLGKKRYINTRFWSDNFVSDLNPLDRYLFLYFLTNEHTNISGIYEIPLRTISFETGIEVDMLKKMIRRLEGKIYYFNGWVYIKNFTKHQGDNESIKIGRERALLEVPEEIMAKVNDIKENNTLSIQPVPSLTPSSGVFESESEFEFESESEFESKLESESKRELEPKKLSHSEFKNVKLTEPEYGKLVTTLGEKETQSLIDELGAYIASSGKRYSSHYATLLNWSRRKKTERNYKTKNITSI